MENYRKQFNALNAAVENEIKSLISEYDNLDVLVLEFDVMSTGVADNYTITGIFHSDDEVYFIVDNDKDNYSNIHLLDLDTKIDLLNYIKNLKAEKVFIVLIDDISEESGQTTNVYVYKTREEARKALRDAAEEIKLHSEWWDKDNPAFDDFVDEDDTFCIWEDGYYNNNHISIQVMEKKIEK